MKNLKNNDQNFWISYADLMAGLLFVFILLIGAIVIKYVYVQSELYEQKSSLEMKKKELKQKQIQVANVSNELLDTKKILNSIKSLLAKQEEQNRLLSSSYEKANKKAKNSEDKLRYELQNSKNLTKQLKMNKNELELSKTELEKLKEYVSQLNLQSKQKDEELKEEQNHSKTLKEQLEINKNELSLSKAQVVKIAAKLLQNQKSHEKLVSDLNTTRQRIKNLTGIRIQAIKILKQKLGNAIEVDPNSGAIRLPSEVLFDVGSHEIKEKAKVALTKTLVRYVKTLLEDKKLRGYIDNIVIEGHTDTDGTYLYNLNLSQKRALNMLDFLYSHTNLNKEILQKYISVSGRSFSNVIKKDGKEDKKASRRIEVKFNISNKKAVKEIEDFLKSDYK